jgi:flagellar hook-length control protein FliK
VARNPVSAGNQDAGNVIADPAKTFDASLSASTVTAATQEHGSINRTESSLAGATDASAQQAAAVQSQAPTTTAAPTATLSAAATGAAVPVSGLALEIAASARSGKTRFDVRLDPADLGRIDVRIDVDRNGQVTSHLTVEKPETLSMLQQDAPQLQRALDDAGFKTGSGGLQFSLRDQSSSGQNSGNDTRGNAQRLVISEENTVPAVVAGRSYGRTLASSGGVDIRV